MRARLRVGEPARQVAAVELQAVHGVAHRRPRRALQTGHQPSAEPAAPEQLRQHGHPEQGRVPGVQHLPQHARQLFRGPAAQEQSDVVQARPGDRRERRDPAVELRPGDRVPGLDRAPVVGQQVDRRVGGDGVGDGAQVGGQTVQVVAVLPDWGARPACAAHVVGDDVMPVGQGRRDAVPHGVVVRVAVDGDHDRRSRRPALLHGEPEPVGSGHLTVRHTVIVENLSTRVSGGRHL